MAPILILVGHHARDFPSNSESVQFSLVNSFETNMTLIKYMHHRKYHSILIYTVVSDVANNQEPLRDPLGSYQQIHPCLARIYSLELVLSIRVDIRSSFGMPPEMRRVYHKRNCTIVHNKHFQNFGNAWKDTNRTEVLLVKIVLRFNKRPVGLSSFVNCPPVVASFLTQRQLSINAGWQHMGRAPHPNYVDPKCYVATVCHHVRFMYWEHLGHFQRVISHLKWHKIVCMRYLACAFSQMKSTDMFSMYLQPGVPRHFIWWFIAGWT